MFRLCMKPSSLLQFYAFNAHLIWTLIINERQQQQHATKYMTFWTLSIAFVVCETRNENKEDEKKSKVTNYWIITFCCVCVSVIYCMDLTRFCFFFSLCISWLKPMIFVQLPHFYSYQLCVFFFLVSFHPVHFYLMHVISAIQCTLISFNTDWRNNDDEWEKKTNTHTRTQNTHPKRAWSKRKRNSRFMSVRNFCLSFFCYCYFSFWMFSSRLWIAIILRIFHSVHFGRTRNALSNGTTLFRLKYLYVYWEMRFIACVSFVELNALSRYDNLESWQSFLFITTNYRWPKKKEWTEFLWANI